jgi:hypothetical protein
MALTLAVLLGGLTQTAASEPPSGQVLSLSGWFHTVWGDRPPDTDNPTPSHGIARYGLVDHAGEWTDLALDEEAVSSSGGLLTFNRQPVVLAGTRQRQLAAAAQMQGGGESRFHVLSIQRQSPLSAQAVAGAAPLGEAAISGPQRWVTVLCRFADSTGTTPYSKTWFDTLMLGENYPGMGHYWQELSYTKINLTGSLVVGWYNLPQPRSYYVYDQNSDGFAELDHGRAARDCAGAADTEVYFPDFIGINLVFNQNLDCCAWGGSWTFALDGQTRSYNVTWLPPWGYENHGVVGHEMGHGFGLPHSSGPYSATYDSRWDVMSNVWDNCWPVHPQYGCIGVHTVSYHKDILGWIGSVRRYVATQGSSGAIEVERLSQPSETGYLMAKIPIGSSTTQFYTVETRRTVGYDEQLPGDAVVIHHVNTTRWDRLAQVVDTDGNGNPNDAGAIWLPGETFVDSLNGITVSVISATDTGFLVAINNGGSTSEFTLTVTKSGNGTVTADWPGIDCGSDCQERFLSGTVVTLAAVPDAGWTFIRWGGDADCTDGRVTMSRDLACTAIFAQGPNLTGYFTSLTRTISRGSDRLSFGLAVQNSGDQPVTSQFSVVFYLSIDGVLDGSDIPLMTRSVRTRRLAPGMTTTVSSRITLPSPGDGKYLLAVIDPNNQIIEADEGDNVVVASVPPAAGRRTGNSATR